METLRRIEVSDPWIESNARGDDAVRILGEWRMVQAKADYPLLEQDRSVQVQARSLAGIEALP